MGTCIPNHATESWIISYNISICVELTATRKKISEESIHANGTVDPGTFNNELILYLRDAVVSSIDYIKKLLSSYSGLIRVSHTTLLRYYFTLVTQVWLSSYNIRRLEAMKILIT